jgi:hypothetical protein
MQLLIIQFPVTFLFISNIPSAPSSHIPSVYIPLLMSCFTPIQNYKQNYGFVYFNSYSFLLR